MNDYQRELFADLKRIIRNTPKRLAARPVMDYVLLNYYPKTYPHDAALKVNGLAPEKVILLVTKHFNISAEQMKNTGRKREIVYARQVCMLLLLLKSRLSLKSVGELMGARDHTTVMYSRDKLKSLMDVYPDIRHEVEFLFSQL